MRTLLRDVEIGAHRQDVELRNGLVHTIAEHLDATGVDEVVDGYGGALLPGLHDHHLHLLATAAAMQSVRCGPPEVRTATALASALRRAPHGGTVRGTGYHESVAGLLDRHALDALVADRPVRIQHRSGGLWMLNSMAMATLVRPSGQGVELDEDGVPNGRLWRRDDLVRSGTGSPKPDLRALGVELDALGLTGATDATPDLGPEALSLLDEAVRSGDIHTRITLLADGIDGAALPARWTAGPLKLLLHDHDLPPFGDLVRRISEAHDSGRPVAVHCVTRTSLLLTIAAMEDSGTLEGDRIEHAAVVPPESRDALARLGTRIVTQPRFVVERGDEYLREVDPSDLPFLYPWATLVDAGVRVAPSSDAPYGELDPWTVMAAATSRTTREGAVVGPEERVPTLTALRGYLSPADDPGGAPRRIIAGVPADLCLLHVPMSVAIDEPDRSLVRRVWHGA